MDKNHDLEKSVGVLFLRIIMSRIREITTGRLEREGPGSETCVGHFFFQLLNI